MSGPMVRAMRLLLGFGVYAYKSLALYFLVWSLLNLATRDGRWFNNFMVFLVLVCIPAGVWALRRFRKQGT